MGTSLATWRDGAIGWLTALVAVQRDAHVKAFFDRLIARGKKPLQTYVAVMRTLLHAIDGMLRTTTDPSPRSSMPRSQNRLDRIENIDHIRPT